MSIADLARPEIRALSAYGAAEQVDDTVRLNANESPRTTGGNKFRRPLNRYPEVRPQRLATTLAERFGCTAEQLLVTRGSSEAIDLLIRTFCRAGIDNIVVPTPSFSMYRHYAQVQGASTIEVPSLAARDFAIDTAALIDACTETSRLVFVCSPNNPTGTPLPRTELLRLLEARRYTSVVVVDEAYVEFGGEPSVIELLDDFPNLVVLRTLSKALGFAGARCGAAIASSELIGMFSAVQAPYALATPVVECVEDVLQSDQPDLTDTLVVTTVRERKRLTAAMQDYPFVRKVWPSDANFFLMRVDDAAGVMEHCRQQKILLRHFGGDLADCIRVTVGSQAENDRLLQALDNFGDE